MKTRMAARIPTSSYRLQFNRDFTLKQALALVPYFHSLGISDLYSSPLMKAVSGSVHCYDVVDDTEMNPEIGGEEDLANLAHALHERGMGIILDIVPNHMCLSEHNKWWQDVLENGRSSLYADYFDIIWSPPKPALKNKILLPILEKPFGEVLENQEITVNYLDGSFFIQYRGGKYPVNPSSYLMILKPLYEGISQNSQISSSTLSALREVLQDLEHLSGSNETEWDKRLLRKQQIIRLKQRLARLCNNDRALSDELQKALSELNGCSGCPTSFDHIERLLAEQAYRLSHWTVTSEEVNYRRFFDISTLITMHTENPKVFDEMHALILTFVSKGWVTGLRVDHVDGLYDPEAYLIRLQNRCAEVLKGNQDQAKRNFFIVVEKILEQQEKLVPRWPVFGTTGYDMSNLLNTLFVQNENKNSFCQLYDQFVEKHDDLQDEVYRSKKLVLTTSLLSNLNILATQLEEIATQQRDAHDYTFDELRAVLQEVIACFPVYRTYIRPDAEGVSQADRKTIQEAIAQAKKSELAKESTIFDFLQSLLLLEGLPGLTQEQHFQQREFVMRFQQFTGPVMAKGLEDTALYRVFPLASLNDVGMNPQAFGIDIDRFHRFNLERLASWPHTLNATSTHDSKRSEDIRARLNVLSEAPEYWTGALERWRQINQPFKITRGAQEVPDRAEEYLLYQTLVGAWPFEPR